MFYRIAASRQLATTSVHTEKIHGMLLSVQGLAVLMDHTGKPRRNSVYGKSHRCFVTRGRKIIEVREETGKEEPAKKTHSGKFNSSYYIGGKHATVVIASLHIR